MFNLTTLHLKTLCERNGFAIPPDEMVFMGFRGCLPLDTEDYSFSTQHKLEGAELNYNNPRCTLVQWFPKKGTFAVYPGSTVPTEKYVRSARNNDGAGANQLCTGYYSDYRKGIHKAGSNTAHEAFRETAEHPIQRTTDDLDYDSNDPVDFDCPFDNIHAGWCESLDGTYSSAGCQVLMGKPKCPNNGSNTKAWKAFHDAAYALSQQAFTYILLKGNEASYAALGQTPVFKVRYGSVGQNALTVQKALKAKGFYEGNGDGVFVERSLRALMAFQRSAGLERDGICGVETQKALGVTLK